MQLQCPTCGNGEMHPRLPYILIRGYKVTDANGNDWSQCLVCAGHYDKQTLEITLETFDEKKGWFCS
jgi:hypothetical protein